MPPTVLGRPEHERILSVFACAFFRTFLLAEPLLPILLGRQHSPGLAMNNIHIPAEVQGAVTVDDSETPGGIAVNSMAQPNRLLSRLTADEFSLSQSGPRPFRFSTFFGNTTGIVAQAPVRNGELRSQLRLPTDVTGKDIWLRVAEVYTGGAVPPGSTGFRLGLEDNRGRIAYLDCDQVGGLARPFDRRAIDRILTGIVGRPVDFTKTILNTLRFPAGCLANAGKIDPKKIVALRIQHNRTDRRFIAYDQLQIVNI